ncbi:MAG: DUF433 domain-containing protein [Fimbriimonadales bacterium]|nr:DUF433 domain-containing protein [Fimbriimonadales bacterium]
MNLLTPPALHEAVWQDPDRLSGEPCFRGTRVPVRLLFEYLAAGAPLSEFLEAFPSVSEAQVRATLQASQQLLLNAIADEACAD